MSNDTKRVLAVILYIIGTIALILIFGTPVDGQSRVERNYVYEAYDGTERTGLILRAEGLAYSQRTAIWSQQKNIVSNSLGYTLSAGYEVETNDGFYWIAQVQLGATFGGEVPVAKINLQAGIRIVPGFYAGGYVSNPHNHFFNPMNGYYETGVQAYGRIKKTIDIGVRAFLMSEGRFNTGLFIAAPLARESFE